MAKADVFLDMQGVTGESTDDKHRGKIEIDGFSWKADAPTDVYSGATTGATALHALVIHKHADRSSPALIKLLDTHKVVPSAALIVRKSGTDRLEYLTITLADVCVSSFRVRGGGALRSDVIERVVLTFARLTYSYTPQDRDGGAGSAPIDYTAIRAPGR